MSYVREKDGPSTCSPRIAKTWENLSASETDATKFKHQQEGTLSFPCADGSLKLSDLLELTVAKDPLEGTWSKMKKQKKWKRHPSKPKTEHIFGA